MSETAVVNKSVVNKSAVITVVIVHDEPAVSAGFAAWYQLASPWISVVAGGADPAVAWTRPGLDAEVVLYGVQQGDPVMRAAQVRKLTQSGRQVLLHAGNWPWNEAGSGAVRCLPRRVTRSQLVNATRLAARGSNATPLPSPPPPLLSPREVDVLRTWLRCPSKSTVAEELGLSARTVSSYLERIRFKYEHAGRTASTKADLLARALQDGLITLAEV
ncbi:helix-turn-helix transcriptional regulator [Actinoalloteichus hymeniacidonis]|uniref:HTH luxR-type domain-containing protein n=1 Tax=Actinoalloteichus hymeniacidonis TaxID=340345 RepID=A0AAC9HSQ5_9PSEU|nr:LuxR C-terminal-related transcriptional regulator [Actinoalloteichus hymeniacidonis]AOS64879.1 hypothetical protein TL08_20440 [Actinoalloteichus hymeniacidonis]MBB5907046.1 DNA-binding NarL/FixJ family response regulator [Actinoalloteichus hymeniacidonis]